MKVFKMFLTIVLLLTLCCGALVAQVTLSSQAGPNFSLTNSVFPTYRYPLATVTGNGTAKFNIGGVSTVSCRVTGTYSAATTALQASNDNTNFTTIAWLNVSTNQLVTSITANGLYQANLGGGMTQLQINNTGTFTGTSQIFNCSGSGTQATDVTSYQFAPSADLCQDKTIQKTAVAITGTAPNTVKAIPLTAGKQTTVCELTLIVGTGATSVTISAGTGTTCGTGNVPLTGAMPIAVGQQMFAGWGGTVWGAPLLPSANDVCVAVAGGTAAYGGWATYVQQ